MSSTTTRANNRRRNFFAGTAGDGLSSFVVTPFVIFNQKNVIKFFKSLDNGKLVSFKLLIVRLVRIIKKKLLKRYKFANKVTKIRNNL